MAHSKGNIPRILDYSDRPARHPEVKTGQSSSNSETGRPTSTSRLILPPGSWDRGAWGGIREADPDRRVREDRRGGLWPGLEFVAERQLLYFLGERGEQDLAELGAVLRNMRKQRPLENQAGCAWHRQRRNSRPSWKPLQSGFEWLSLGKDRVVRAAEKSGSRAAALQNLPLENYAGRGTSYGVRRLREPPGGSHRTSAHIGCE